MDTQLPNTSIDSLALVHHLSLADTYSHSQCVMFSVHLVQSVFSVRSVYTTLLSAWLLDDRSTLSRMGAIFEFCGVRHILMMLQYTIL